MPMSFKKSCKLGLALIMLCGCGTNKKDEYGIDQSKYDNVIHCETVNDYDDYRIVVIEQIYGNNGVLDYLYHDELTLFNNHDLVKNTKESKEELLPGFDVEVIVTEDYGSVDSITRIDFTKLDLKAYFELTKNRKLDAAELDEASTKARNIGQIDLDYCEIVK